MNFLLMTLGSIGDFFPFLAVAEGLRRRKHRVVLASNAGYAPLARRAGFEFAIIWERSGQSLDGVITQNPQQAWKTVRKEMFLPAIGPARNCISHYTRKGGWRLLASWSICPSAWDRFGLPLCRIYLSPDTVARDQDYRDDSPNLRNIGLFPEWFGGTPGIKQTSFAILEDSLVPGLPQELEAFLRQGQPPVIFTPGSFMRSASRFFQESLTACLQLGLRAIFLTPYREQVPNNLPADIRHFKYMPLQRLAPRCAALVHHGGIGTCAQGLKAGIPQLVTPFFFDQPDNATRLEALGVSSTLIPSSYQRDSVTKQLQEIMQCELTRQNCARVAARFRVDNAIAETCDIAEALVG